MRLEERTVPPSPPGVPILEPDPWGPSPYWILSCRELCRPWAPLCTAPCAPLRPSCTLCYLRLRGTCQAP